ncbi:MAG: serine/threonine-protein kinase, partial [Pirellulales bacterium]
MAIKSGATSEADLLQEQRLASLEIAGPHIGGYEIRRKIGQGTYGDVWEALDSNTRVIVAIKRLRKLPTGNSVEDCDLLAELNDAPGIVRLHKLHLDEEPYCFAMEYMRGGSLADLLKQGPLPFDQAWHMFREITKAMAYVHKRGLVHCDLKPANILLDARSEPRIGDFGQARKVGSGGASYGTQFYMPPEQAREGQPDTSWDVYALGAILYEMLTGKRPYFTSEISDRMSASARSGSNIRDRQELYARHMEESASPTSHRKVKGVDSSVTDLIDHCL